MKITQAGLALAATTLMGAAAFAQGPGRPAQQSGLDISGSWFAVFHQEQGRTAGGNLVEYAGVPINEGGRLYALAWDPSRFTIRQQQCAAYTPSPKRLA